jgi:prepilin-type N-terminal cleavage/methylation domain-containing protein
VVWQLAWVVAWAVAAQFEMKKHHAFSLTELSVVVAVIALLMVGVVTAQSLVQESKRMAIISEFRMYNAAIQNFREKYGSLPGDMTNATTIFGATDINGYTVTNGNGNGWIGFSGPTSAESRAMWQELALGGFIPGVYQGESQAVAIGSTLPKSKYADNLSWYPYVDYVGKLWSNYNSVPNGLAATGITGGTDWYQTAIPVMDAYKIDIKIDDGLPYTGKVISANGNAANKCVATMLSAAPAHTLPYYLTDTTQSCTMMFAIGDGIFR